MGMRQLWDIKGLDEPGSQGAVHGAGAVGSSSHPAPFQSLTQPCAFSPCGSPCVVVIVSQVHMRNNLAGKAKQRTGERAPLSEDGGDRQAQRSSLPCPPGVHGHLSWMFLGLWCFTAATPGFASHHCHQHGRLMVALGTPLHSRGSSAFCWFLPLG